MTKIERIMKVIYGEPVDKIPKGEFFLEEGLVANLTQLVRSEKPKQIDFKSEVGACEWLGLDALVFSPDKKGDDAWNKLKRWREGSDFFLFAIVDGPFQGIYHQYEDFTDFLMDTMRNTERLQAQAEEIAQKSRELAMKAFEAGANGVIVADDIAYNQGLYVSPKTMREIFFPYLKDLVSSLSLTSEGSDVKKPIFFHSDGNLLQILEDIKAIGFNGIHSLEPIMDIGQVREIVGEEVCLMGGFDLGWFKEEGPEKAKEILSKMVPGRYIFGSSAGILDATLPAEEVLRVYRYVEEYSQTI